MKEDMKIIDLLNKIANGEELPKKFKYYGYIFEYDTNHSRYESYFDEQIWTLQDFVNINDNLNDELEIIEDKKIEKIKEKIQLIQTYTDDERILAQCNLILKELDDKAEFKEIPFFEGTMEQLEKLTIKKGDSDE